MAAKSQPFWPFSKRLWMELAAMVGLGVLLGAGILHYEVFSRFNAFLAGINSRVFTQIIDLMATLVLGLLTLFILRWRTMRAHIRRSLEAERKLEQNLARYHTLFEVSPSCIMVLDAQGIIRDVNSAFFKTLGYRPAELLNRSISVLSDGETGQAIEENIRRVLAGEIMVHTLPNRRRDGAIRHMALNEIRIDLEDGAPGILVIAHDVTQQKEVEAELRASQERYALAVGAGQTGVWEIWPEQGRILADQNLCRLIGYEPGELDGDFRRWLKLIPREFHRDIRYGLDDIARSGRIEYRVEHPITRRDGSRGWFSSVGRAYAAEGARPMRIVGVSNDVSDRKEAVEALRASEEKYRTIVENAHDAIFILQDGRFVDCNTACLELFGARLESIVGRGLGDFSPEAQYDGRPTALHIEEKLKAVNEGRTLTFDWLCRRADGAALDTEVGLAACDVQGRPLIVGNVRDMTERKRAEQERRRLDSQMQQAQKLESLGILAGGIAHDFNNLLLGVLGYAGLAMDVLPADSPARNHVQMISSSAQRAADLTRQMLAYSGRGKFVIKPLDISGLVEEMTHLLRISISKRALLSLNLAPDLPPIEADEAQLQQIVMNLLTNASDALGEKDGTILLETGVAHCRADELRALDATGPLLPEGKYVYLQVADSGCGMNSATMQRIFDPFYTTKFTGRGLGLASVSGIVRGHRGVIQIQSRPGKGTTFKVLFPAMANAVVEAAAAPSEQAAWRGKGLVLVVDDEPIVRDFAKAALTHAGLEVAVAGDGLEGEERVRELGERVDLVLLDLTMPRRGGEETFRAIRAIDPTLPVILSSGYSDPESIERFMEDGAAGFIQKPYRPGELLALVRKAMRSRKPRPVEKALSMLSDI